MKRTPTFRQGTQLLIGTAAREAWAAQTVRCACGDYGDTDNAISGSANDMPAEWLGCPNCTGSSVGRPLVYRVQSQIAAARKEMAAK